MWFCLALNQLAGTGWLTGDELKNFISRLPINTIGNLNPIGLEIFPSSGSTRRQLIHSLDLLVRFGSSQNEQQKWFTIKNVVLLYRYRPSLLIYKDKP
jgi:hypothetical protein